MPPMPITRVVLYKHGVGYFERQGGIEGDATLSLTFKQDEVSDVLKSLTVLDLNGGHIASVSYDSTKPLEQLLADVALSIPDKNSLTSLLPQLKGARVAIETRGEGSTDHREGVILGIDFTDEHVQGVKVTRVLLSILGDEGSVRSFDLHALARLELLDDALKKDLDFYLRTVLSSKKKDARTFTFFAQGEGERTIQLSYTLAAPVWKATYRILLGEEGSPPMIQGWAVVDNTQDEDWENVQLSLIAGLPVSFIHDLYTPRYIRRPVVEVKETTGVLPPTVEEGMLEDVFMGVKVSTPGVLAAPAAEPAGYGSMIQKGGSARMSGPSSTPAQVRERKLGDLFEYEIEHPVTIRRNQSALVPIVLRSFEGRPVLLHNPNTRRDNPMRCVEFKNTTGLTLEGGPVTVLEGGSYVGEAMLETTKPDDEKLVPYAVELGVSVIDNVDSHHEEVHRVVFRDGWLTTYRMQVMKTTYHFNNKAEVEQKLFVDQPRPSERWELMEPRPHETTQNYWRFRLTLPPKRVTSVPVVQHETLEHRHALGNLSVNQLGFWLEQKYLDDRTRDTLRQVLACQQRLAEVARSLQALDQERQAIHNEQHRIRENLQALGDRPSEKELRERLVRTLNTQEDRLEQITSETAARNQELEQTREQLNKVIPSVEFEAKL